MIRIVAAAFALIGVALTQTLAQTPAVTADQQYVFIDAEKTTARFLRTIDLSKVRDELVNAGNKGYGVHFMAGSSSSANLLLSREGTGPRSYRLVTTSREGAFLSELNEAGSQGFRIVPGTIKALERGSSTTWVAVLAPRSDNQRFKYSVVKGTKDGTEALAASSKAGRLLVGILGRQGMIAANTLLFFEEIDGDRGASPTDGERGYRIVATSRTSALEKDINEAAAGGFRVIGAGFGYMTVVMARAREPSTAPVEYRVIAMMRVATAIQELQAAGAQGFRIAAMSENKQEGVFVLHRAPGTLERFEYQLSPLQWETANQTLLDAEADGYRTYGLFSDLVVLERPLARRP